MGYTTDFYGEVTIDPPLNPQEIAYLQRFSDSRRMHRSQGPYYANPGNDWGQSGTGILNYNEPPQQQPGLWCHWVPTEDGSAICWDGAEKFYDSAEWMAYLITTFLQPGATVQQELRALAAGGTGVPALRQPEHGWVYPPEFAAFTFDHIVNGAIDASGEAPDDIWRLVVRDNVVSVQSGQITFADETVLGDDTSAPIRVTATRMDQPGDERLAVTAGTPALPAATSR
ncbi:hypothetical protein [Amycolatopsis sp. cg9]|uniref:hypothetical protein n=1 Tax=Amycolatopsis sp. cg9 TaxID=3238801 RepID=UPI00352558B8